MMRNGFPPISIPLLFLQRIQKPTVETKFGLYLPPTLNKSSKSILDKNRKCLESGLRQ